MDKPRKTGSKDKQVQILAEEGKEDILVLAKHIFRYELISEREHRPLADFLMSRRMTYSVIACSRDTCKTTLVSQVYPIFRMIRGEVDLSTLLTSHTHKTSQKRLQNIQRKVKSSIFRACYGDWFDTSLTWNDQECSFAVRHSTSVNEFSIETAGIDVEKTGGHYRLIIPDDLHSEKNTRTEDQKKLVLDHLKLYGPMLSQRDKKIDNTKSELIVVCTPWCDDDAVYEFKKSLGTGVSVLEIPAYSKKSVSVLKDIRSFETQQEFEDAGFELNFPLLLPFERLKREASIDWTFFSSQFLLDVASSEAQMFQRDSIEITHPDDLPSTGRIVILCDPAGDPTAAAASKRDSDFTAIAALLLTPQERIILIDMFLGIVNPSIRIDKMVSMILKYKQRLFLAGVEIGGTSEMKFHVEQELRKRGEHHLIVPLSPGGRSKKERIEGMTRYMDNRLFSVLEGCPFSDEVITQFCKIPRRGRSRYHDDAPDAISYVIDIVKKYGFGYDKSMPEQPTEDKYANLDSRSREIYEDIEREEKKNDYREDFRTLCYT